MRTLWFVAGAGAGAYAMTRARRAAEMFTPEGWSDRRAGLRRGAQMFQDSYAQARADKETELRERLGLPPGGPLALSSAPRDGNARRDTLPAATHRLAHTELPKDDL